MEKKFVIENEKNEMNAEPTTLEYVKLMEAAEERLDQCETSEDFDSFVEEFDSLLDEFDFLPDGFSKESMQRLEYEVSQIENGCDIISVFEQEGLKLDDDILNEFKKFTSIAILSTDELNALFVKLDNGDSDTKQQIVNANQMLVALVAKEYFIKEGETANPFDIRRFNMSFEELTNIGNKGLEKAISKFDYAFGYKFYTYALWWICSAFSRAVVDLFHIPVHMVETIKLVFPHIQQMRKELEREPTLQELAEKLDMRIDKVQKIINIIQEISTQGEL